jgi:hypothetical protein
VAALFCRGAELEPDEPQHDDDGDRRHAAEDGVGIVRHDADNCQDPASEAGQDVDPVAHDIETTPASTGLTGPEYLGHRSQGRRPRHGLARGFRWSLGMGALLVALAGWPLVAVLLDPRALASV